MKRCAACVIFAILAASISAAMIFFHLLRRFWNQIFTCVSVKRSEAARPARSDELRYLLVNKISVDAD